MFPRELLGGVLRSNFSKEMCLQSLSRSTHSSQDHLLLHHPMPAFTLSFESPEVDQVELNTPESAASADRTVREMELVSLTPAEMYAMEKR
jgi:hypothetical protein